MSNMNNEVLDIGFDSAKNPYEAFVRRTGGDFIRIKMLLELDYKEYKEGLEDLFRQKTSDGSLSSDDQDELDELTFEEFSAQKSTAVKQYNEWSKLQKELEKENIGPYIKPYKRIFNGVFETLDKDSMTDELKRIQNVQGLPDECWDVYVDKDNGKLVTIYYDYDTLNEHFFAFSVFLEKYKKIMNIPNINHKIPLILFDRTLMHVDTDDEALSYEMRTRIANECKINPFYYFREVARILDEKINKLVRYQMTLATYSFLWLYCQCFNTFKELPRQMGKTFDSNNTGGYEFGVGSRNSMILVVHYKRSEAEKNRNNMIAAVNKIPKYLRIHNITKRIKKGKEVWEEGPDLVGGSKVVVSNEFFNNQLKVTAVGKSETTASQVGRGDTVHFVFIDELNYVANANTVLTAVQFAHGMASILKDRAGERYGMHFMSTAGELNTQSGKDMYKLVHEGMCKFDPVFFGYNYDDLRTVLEKNSSKMFFYITFQYYELGFGEDWVDKAIEKSTTREKFQQDILNVWLSGSAKSIFSMNALTRIRTMSQKCLHVTYMYKKYNKFVYFPKNRDIDFETFIKQVNAMNIGIDISNGTSNDSSVMIAVDLETARPLFSYKNNQLNALDFSILLIDFVKYLKRINPNLKLTLNVENDGPGQTVIPILRKDKEIEQHLFRLQSFIDKYKGYQVKATTKKINNDVEVIYGTGMRKWRKALTDVLLFDLVDKYPYAFQWEEAYNELTTLIRKSGASDGKILAAAGFHDDIVMATLHAYSPIFLEEFVINLERYFDFVIDYRKIESMSLDSHIISHEFSESNNNIEGKIDYKIITKKDPMTGQEYDELKMTKVINGVKVELTTDEIAEEMEMNNELKYKDDIRRMRLRRFEISNIPDGIIVSGMAERSLASLSYTPEGKRIQGAGRVMNNVESQYYDREQKSETGMQMSHDGRINRDYYKSISNNYKARLF